MESHRFMIVAKAGDVKIQSAEIQIENLGRIK